VPATRATIRDSVKTRIVKFWVIACYY